MYVRPAFLLAFCTLTVPASGQSALTNQSIYDTAPNLPEHYEERVAQFEAEPVVTGGIMFLGNSITEGADWRALLGDSTVVNRGIGGDVTYGVLRRLDDVIRLKPSKLFVMIGINDISKDIPPELIADNHRRIIEQVRAGSPETEILIQNLLPLNPEYPGFPQRFDKVDMVMRTNRLVRQVAVEAGVRYINLYPVFMDAQERLDEQLTTDGLHLNESGYAVWVGHLREMGYLGASSP